MNKEELSEYYHIDFSEAAIICHEVNRAYCATIHDFSQPIWEDASDWQKKSAIDGVYFYFLERHAGNDVGPIEMHDNWLRHKANDGWVYGKTKDAEKKTHPCMVRYEDLPAAQQKKDELFHIIVDGYFQMARNLRGELSVPCVPE